MPAKIAVMSWGQEENHAAVLITLNIMHAVTNKTNLPIQSSESCTRARLQRATCGND